MHNQSPTRDSDYFPKNPLPLVFLVEQGIIWHGIYPWSVWVSCRGCVTTLLCAHLQPSHCGVQRGRKSKYCSAAAKAPVCCQHCFSHKSKTQHPLQKINSIPARPSTPTPFTWHQTHFLAHFNFASIDDFCWVRRSYHLHLYICLINCPFFPDVWNPLLPLLFPFSFLFSLFETHKTTNELQTEM